jgi:hypothetical protein
MAARTAPIRAHRRRSKRAGDYPVTSFMTAARSGVVANIHCHSGSRPARRDRKSPDGKTGVKAGVS